MRELINDPFLLGKKASWEYQDPGIEMYARSVNGFNSNIKTYRLKSFPQTLFTATPQSLTSAILADMGFDSPTIPGSMGYKLHELVTKKLTTIPQSHQEKSTEQTAK